MVFVPLPAFAASAWLPRLFFVGLCLGGLVMSLAALSRWRTAAGMAAVGFGLLFLRDLFSLFRDSLRLLWRGSPLPSCPWHWYATGVESGWALYLVAFSLITAALGIAFLGRPARDR